MNPNVPYPITETYMCVSVKSYIVMFPAHPHTLLQSPVYMDFIKWGSPNGQSKVSSSLINVIRSSKYTSGQMQDNGLVVIVCVFFVVSVC